MRRLYFLVPDSATAGAVVDELLLARVPYTRIHVLAREGSPLGDLPEAGLAQRSDLIPALQRGLALGGATGMLAGLVAVAIPGAAVVSAGAIVAASALAGSAVGAWLSSMVGIGIDSPRFKPFEQAIESGQLLLMVDVAAEDTARITERITRRIPGATPEGVEPGIPAFP